MGRGGGSADIAIVGAGGAGLSLAAALADAGPRVGRVVVVDARTSFARDRTWCFWDVHPQPFGGAVTHRWSRWRVTAPDGTEVTRTSGRYTYQHVPADAFYADALARIARAPNVELRLGERVLAVEDAGPAAHVVTAGDVLRVAHVFDSRPAGSSRETKAGSGHPVRLVQAFAGVAVGTDVPAFDPSAATLMDFTLDWDGSGIGFGYLLPYTACEALVEVAVIADTAPAPGALEAALAGYVARVTAGARVAVRWREAGVIPMDAAPVQRRPSPRVTRIGVAGGMAKPSTGYAFLAMQRDAAHLARAFSQGAAAGGRHPAPAARGHVAQGLDHVFLRRLRADWAGAPALFARLFARAEPDALVRFLSDVASPRDVAHVVAALPPAPFVAEACRMALRRRPSRGQTTTQGPGGPAPRTPSSAASTVARA